MCSAHSAGADGGAARRPKAERIVRVEPSWVILAWQVAAACGVGHHSTQARC